MKIRHLSSALAIAALCVSGASFAQVTPTANGSAPSDPGNTNVSPIKGGTNSYESSGSGTGSTSVNHMGPKDNMSGAPSAPGNTNDSPIKAPKEGNGGPAMMKN